MGVLELILWCLLNYHQGSRMLETIFLFLIVSSTVESQIQHRPKIRQRDEGREVKCASSSMEEKIKEIESTLNKTVSQVQSLEKELGKKDIYLTSLSPPK